MRNLVLWFGLLVSLAAGQGYIGRLDTIGSTTYDWQNGWHAVKCLVNAPEHGLHATWIRSFSTSGTDFPDRRQYYNYYDFAARRWTFMPDTSPMLGGAEAFTVRTGNGNVDYDPASGVAIIASHHVVTGGIVTIVAKDAAPGAGIFDYADGESVLGLTQWPRLATGQNGTIHVFSMSQTYDLAYSRILPDSWPRFEPPWHPVPNPGYPTFSVAASKVSGKVSLIWEMSYSAPESAYITTSTDNGATWESPWELEPPSAFGGDTVTSFHITSLYPWYDFEDRLHVVANLMPVVHDTGYVVPSQIWHWCPDNNPQWTRIHIASCDSSHMQASVGYNATYADRPSIGEDKEGWLYVAWEQFDSSNVEPTTSRLRAGIWLSGSGNNGMTWTPGGLVTERNTCSHRFPSIVDRMVPGDRSEDTVCVLYMIDSVSGFYVQSEGPASLNPIVCQFITNPPGIEEAMNEERVTMNAGPTIVRGVLFLPRAENGDSPPERLRPTGRGTVPIFRAALLDISGRKVMDLAPGANDVRRLSPGVYFVRFCAGGKVSTGRLTLVR